MKDEVDAVGQQPWAGLVEVWLLRGELLVVEQIEKPWVAAEVEVLVGRD